MWLYLPGCQTAEVLPEQSHAAARLAVVFHTEAQLQEQLLHPLGPASTACLTVLDTHASACAQMMLLSDGSVTRHLQLLTGQPIQVVRRAHRQQQY